jgi:hypothetical protein
MAAGGSDDDRDLTDAKGAQPVPEHHAARTEPTARDLLEPGQLAKCNRPVRLVEEGRHPSAARDRVGAHPAGEDHDAPQSRLGERPDGGRDGDRAVRQPDAHP